MKENFNHIFKNSVQASKELSLLCESTINEILNLLAKETENNIDYILSENKKDTDKMPITNPKYDRLLLNQSRIENIIEDLKNVAKLPYPVGYNFFEKKLNNGLIISKVSVPFGVVGIIYEARPNVSFDVFSLCLKSGNACLLKGGSDAYHSNQSIVNIIKKVLEKTNVNSDVCTLLPTDRSATDALLNANRYVDLVIPRGGKELIEYVRKNSLVPVIETGAGVCHTYFHEDGKVEFGEKIIHNAKTRKVSVCNSLDCLIIDESRINDLPKLCESLVNEKVIIYADDASYKALLNTYPQSLLTNADEQSFGTEFLDYKMSIKTVKGLDEAIEHINMYSSKHSETIISENLEAIHKFETLVDSACIYSNASTAFTDGAQFDLGAEIGISTQKMHARGPMALKELCTYKWIIKGNGQIR
ncbi:glutamate-5-semialdehyde dehydrogenase [Apibacter muscae]|uniref:Gamma-glutamyl phosphate reductase n=1 Tax=Apibacter muscae TaxID=2509004 RepID=A0A563D8Q5_9FLAO|nr:glutamate-5-semialdehyde dehydrogenase [Apibacter muscae]TWP26626.1 glutamate-5-semialdehyde dehydrogenase [Apibacter muscae]TWP28200.1 glutamate-5-semialdehyde dehydrogenase [Apibacter muscae]